MIKTKEWVEAKRQTFLNTYGKKCVRNPLTGRAIVVDGPTYKALEKQFTSKKHEPSTHRSDVTADLSSKPLSKPVCKHLAKPQPKLIAKVKPSSKVVVPPPKPPRRTPPVKPAKSVVTPTTPTKRSVTPDSVKTAATVANHVAECKVDGSLKSRQHISTQIISNVVMITSSEWRDHVIALNQRKQHAQQKVVDLRIIGSGSFGQVYLGKLGCHDIAVKEASYRKTKKIKEPEEYAYLQLVNVLLNDGTCPHFPFVYGLLYYDDCSIKLNSGKQKTGPCYVTFMEAASGTLTNFINDTDIQSNLLFQILAGLHAMQMRYQFVHYDIKTDNILIRRIAKGGESHYKVFGTDYYLPNIGLLVLISDFGVSQSLSPKYSKNTYFGERNAAIEGDNLYPFKSEMFISRLKGNTFNVQQPEYFKWKDMTEKFTRNRFYARKDCKPSVKVDLLKPEVFPPFEFYNDIQDTIRMFCGGKQTTQPGSHTIPSKVNPQLLALLKRVALTSHYLYNTTWNTIDNAHHFLAGKMIQRIFSVKYCDTERKGATPSLKSSVTLNESYILVP